MACLPLTGERRHLRVPAAQPRCEPMRQDPNVSGQGGSERREPRVRLVLAMLLAPAAGMVLSAALAFELIGLATGDRLAFSDIVPASMGIAAISAPVAYPLSWMLGLPVHAFMTSRGLVALHHYVLAGLIVGCGAVIASTLFGHGLGASSPHLVYGATPLVLLAGPCIAMVAWIIVSPRRARGRPPNRAA